MSQTVALLIACTLVAINAFFVAAEFSLVKARATRLAELARRGSGSAQLAHRMVGRIDSYLSATQLGITLTSLGLGWVGEPAFAHLFEKVLHDGRPFNAEVNATLSIALAFLVMTFMHIIFGELTPRSLALQRSERVLLATARPLYVFNQVFFPLTWTMNRVALFVLRFLKLGPVSEHEAIHTPEEIRMLLSRSLSVGGQAVLRERLVENLFTFSRRTARQIMIPRTDVVLLSVKRPLPEIIQQVQAAGHTRYPVCDGDLDKVLGIAHIKDLARVPDPARADIRGLLREPLFVPEVMTAERLLLTFQETRQHLAIVVDEYGGASGLVTLEDVIEELVGEVQDEFDEEAPKFIPVRRGGYLVSAGMLVEAVAAQLGVKIEEVDADTMGGYVQHQLGTLGRVGDEVPFGDHTIRVVEVRGRRLVRLLIQPPARAGAPAAAG